jgi:hypothetical protein
MSEDTGEYPLAKRDRNDVLILPPVTEPLAGEYRERTSEDGYVRLSYIEAKHLLGRLDSLTSSLLESDRWLAGAIRRILDGWGDAPAATT